jgi:membrane protease YdiL (CAAX protease family)
MQTSWGRKGPSRTILGAEIGPGFLATQALFAAGHLVTLQPWRLATFFPGLLFGWLRARTGGVVAPAVAHALSNLLLLFLEASLAPHR